MAKGYRPVLRDQPFLLPVEDVDERWHLRRAPERDRVRHQTDDLARRFFVIR